MEKASIKEAYDLAERYNASRKEAVNIGIQMALQGEVIVEGNKVVCVD